eukprot:3782453-Rhodomonas_salina.1
MNGDPQDYPESQRLPRAEATKWQEATDSEMASIDKHEVCEWIDEDQVPAGEEIVLSWLVYTKKVGKQGQVT